MRFYEIRENDVRVFGDVRMATDALEQLLVSHVATS